MRNVYNSFFAIIMMTMITIMIMMMMMGTANAASEPVCAYRNSEDETIFLKYLPLLKKGQDYVDFGKDGKCLKRAICSDTFKITTEDCAQQKISCVNKQRFTGVFPGCCIKCP